MILNNMNKARKGKLNGKTVWILDKIKTARGDTMIYYRELGSYPFDVKTKIWGKRI